MMPSSLPRLRVSASQRRSRSPSPYGASSNATRGGGGGNAKLDAPRPWMEVFAGRKLRRVLDASSKRDDEGDDTKLDAFLSQEFDRLDLDGRGVLSLAGMKPALLRLAELQGLLMWRMPERSSNGVSSCGSGDSNGCASNELRGGSSGGGGARVIEENKELIEGLFATFMSPDLSSEIGRHSFVSICKDLILASRDSLEEDPLARLFFPGSILKDLFTDVDELDWFLDSLFADVDADGDGWITVDELRPLLPPLGLYAGEVPMGREEEDRLLADLLLKYGRGGSEENGIKCLGEGVGSANTNTSTSTKRSERPTSPSPSPSTSKSSSAAAAEEAAAAEGCNGTASPSPSSPSPPSNPLPTSFPPGAGLSKQSFVLLMADELQSLLQHMEDEPLYLPANMTILNGPFLVKLLSDESFFTRLTDLMFLHWDTTDRGMLSRAEVSLGFTSLGVAYGLPAVTADEADRLYLSLFLSADTDTSGFVDKPKFRSLMHAIFLGATLQMQRKQQAPQTPTLVDPATGQQEQQPLTPQSCAGDGDGGDDDLSLSLPGFTFSNRSSGGSGSLLPPASHTSSLAQNGAFFPQSGALLPTAAEPPHPFSRFPRASSFSLSSASLAASSRYSSAAAATAASAAAMAVVAPLPTLTGFKLFDGRKVRKMVRADGGQCLRFWLEGKFDELHAQHGDGSGWLPFDVLPPTLLLLLETLGLPRRGAAFEWEQRVGELLEGEAKGGEAALVMGMDREGFVGVVGRLLRFIGQMLQDDPLLLRCLDGTPIRALLESPSRFARLSHRTFLALDPRDTNRLPKAKLAPALRVIGLSAGLPVKGANPTLDRWVAEIVSECARGQVYVTEEEFTLFMHDALAQLAARLADCPIYVSHEFDSPDQLPARLPQATPMLSPRVL